MSGFRNILLGTALGLATATAAMAVDPVQQHNSNAVWFENWIGLRNATMTIVTPDGEVIKIQSTSGTPVFELRGDQVVDGVYQYELVAATDEEIEIKNPIDNGRGDQARNTQQVPYYTSGTFVVSRGVIITPEEVQEDG